MNRLLSAALLACLVAASGCAKMKPHRSSGPVGFGVAAAGMADGFVANMESAPAPVAPSSSMRADRKLIWYGNLTMDVGNVSNSVARTAALVAEHGGYVENSSGDETYASLTIRLPSAKLQNAISALEQLGDVTHRNLSSTDVTEEYVDIEARRANLVVLRDRLRALLDRTQEVKEIVAVEKELNRVQSELDSLDARMKALKGQIDFASLTVTFHRKPILGPLGYVVKGVWWAVEKLFVIRR